MRHHLLFLLFPIIIIAAACADQRRTDSDVLQVWHPFNPEETALFRELVRDFEERWQEQNGQAITVSLQYVSFDDMYTKLRSAALAGITPDVVFMDVNQVIGLAFSDALLRLNELDGFRARYGSIEAAREDFYGQSFDVGVVNRLGEVDLYGLPVQVTTIALYWNRELFRQKGRELREAGLASGRAPRTWEEFEEYAAILTDPERRTHGYGAHGSLWFNLPFFNMYGAEFVEYDDLGRIHPVFDSGNARAALRRIQAIGTADFEAGAWRTGASPEGGFINNRIAMILTGPWMVESFANAGVDFDVSLIPAPSPEEIDQLGLQPADPDLVDRLGPLAYSSSNLGGQTGVIMRESTRADLGYEFLEFFTSEEIQRRWGSRLGQIPVRTAAWEELDTSRYPFMPVFIDQLRTARRVPPVPRYSTMDGEIFTPQILMLLQGRLGVEEFAGRMDRLMRDRMLDSINRAAEAQQERIAGR